MSKIIDSIRETILTCQFLSNCKVNIDYVGTEMSYSIDPLPCDPIIKKYVDGGSQRQYQFAFTSKEEYDEDARVNIENSGFCEEFEDWLDKQLPVLPEGKIPVKFETLNKGYLYDIDGNKAKYRIECRLIYEQEVM